jgi:hypothetical protein
MEMNGMCLFGFHHRTEFLVFGYKGKIEMYPKRKAFPTVVYSPSKHLRHSEKPQIFRDLIMPFGEKCGCGANWFDDSAYNKAIDDVSEKLMKG